MYKTAAQLFRYGLVGITSNVIGYLLFLLATSWGVGVKTAMTVLYAAGVIVGFCGNRSWTFTHRGSLLDAGTKYVLAHCCGYLLNFGILYAFVDRLGYPHQWVQAVAIFVVAGFLFMFFKYFVFAANGVCKRHRQ